MTSSNKLIIGILTVIAVSLWIFFGFTLFSDEQFDDTNSHKDSSEDISQTIVAIVNGEQITSDELSEAIQSYEQINQNVSSKQALDLLINHTILYQQAKNEGYVLTDEETELEFEHQLSERNLTKEQYKQDLDELGISYTKKLQDFKEHVSIQDYLDDLTDGIDINVTEEEAKDFYVFLNQQSNSLNQSYEEMRSYIFSYIQDKKQQDEINNIIADLRENAEIEYI